METTNNMVNSFLVYSTLIILTVPCIISDTPNFNHISRAQPLILKPNTTHLGTIIFFHGHSQEGTDWKDELEIIREPYMKVISPTANEFPLTYQNGYEMTRWFDFWGNQSRYGEIPDDAEGMNESIAFINHLIDEEIKLGIPAEKIVLCGFSQGGSLALEAGLTCPRKLGAIVSFSMLPPMNKTFDPRHQVNYNLEIPILHSYRTNVWYVSPAAAELVGKQLKNLASNVECLTYPEHKHFIPPEALLDAKAFIVKHTFGNGTPHHILNHTFGNGPNGTHIPISNISLNTSSKSNIH